MKKTGYKWIIALLIILGGGTSYCLYAAPHKRVSNPLESLSPTQAESSVYPAVWKAEQAANQPKVFSVSVSPDGKYTLIETKLPSLPAQGSYSKLSLVENASSKVMWYTDPKESVLFSQWSPTGDQITFLRSDKKKTELLVTALDNWDPRQLLITDEEVKGYKWAPNGEKIVVVSTSSQYKEQNKHSFTVGSQSDSIRLSFIPLNKASKKKEIKLEGYVFPNFNEIEKVIAWSPDGKNLALSVFSQDERAEALFNLQIESENTVVLHPHGNPLYPIFSPDGTKIAYVADLSEKEKSLFKVKRRRVYVKENNANKSTPLAATFAEDPILIGWYPDNKNLLLQEGYKTLNHLYKLPINGENPETIGAHNTEQLVSHVSVNSTGTYIGFVQESLDLSPAAYISPLDSFNPQSISHNFLLTVPIKSELIQWKSFDGTEIEGLFIYPFNYKEGQKYPLLVGAHDGPYGAWKRNFIGLCSEAVPFSPAVFASRGYAVLLPNIRGSSSYGIEFAKAIDKDIGGVDFKDLMAGIDHLVSKGIADPDRLALWGWGYGGYLATWATTQTDRFKTVLVGAGITDLISFAGTTSAIGYLESYLGGYFWNDKPLWLSRSPIMHVPMMKTPTLLLYGAKDKVFPTSQGGQLYYALKSRDIPVKMMTFDQEDHNFNFAPSLQEGLKLALEWFDLYLQPERSKNSSSKEKM